jgi:hypothetical protein
VNQVRSGFAIKFLYAFFISPATTLCFARFILLDIHFAKVNITKLLITEFSPASCYFLLNLRYS